MRRYEDPIQVRTVAVNAVVDAAGDATVDVAVDAAQQAPREFIWRGRLYVVRAVIAQWQERSAWWRQVLAPPRSGELAGAHGLRDIDLEEQIWRVEASPGRLAGAGVFDLATGDSQSWRLVRVAD